MSQSQTNKGASGAAKGNVAPSLRVTQVKSEIGRAEKQRRVLRGLGLRGPHSSVVVKNDAAFRGAIRKVLHLVTVEEVHG